MKATTLKLAPIVAALLVVACSGANSGDASSAASSDTQAATDDAPKDKSTAGEVSATDMVIGDPNAPVTIIEYASVTCPGCAAFHERVFPGLKEKFVDTGKAKIVFREFPTPPVDFSMIGSVMARCAGEKGGSEAYFLVINALFQNQRTWIYGEDPKAELLKIASQAGMDEEAFDTCLKRQELLDAIEARVKEGSSEFNINSTPSFVMNGKKINARSLDDFEAAINEAIEKEAS